MHTPTVLACEFTSIEIESLSALYPCSRASSQQNGRKIQLNEPVVCTVFRSLVALTRWPLNTGKFLYKPVHEWNFGRKGCGR